MSAGGVTANVAVAVEEWVGCTPSVKWRATAYEPEGAVCAEVTVSVACAVAPGAIARLLGETAPVHPAGTTLFSAKALVGHAAPSRFETATVKLRLLPAEPLCEWGEKLNEGVAAAHANEIEAVACVAPWLIMVTLMPLA